MFENVYGLNFSVKSFADRRWTITKEQNLYTSIGFELTEILPENVAINLQEILNDID